MNINQRNRRGKKSRNSQKQLPGNSASRKQSSDLMVVKKMQRRRRIRRTIALVVLLFFALGALMVWKVFVVEKVEVKGNEIYEDQQIEDWVLNDDKSWNSLYVFLKNKFVKSEEIPFVESMNVTLKNPKTVQITVTEKGILGYTYISAQNKYAYLDKDGYVVELSTRVIDGVTQIAGLEAQKAVLYKELDVDNATILRTLLSVTQILKKYERQPDIIVLYDGDIYLSYGRIQVNLGSGTYLNEKILRMDEIYPQIQNMRGTLHMETWTEDSTDVYFKKNDLITIESETVTGKDTDDSDQSESEKTSGSSSGKSSENTAQEDSSADEEDTTSSSKKTSSDKTSSDKTSSDKSSSGKTGTTEDDAEE